MNNKTLTTLLNLSTCAAPTLLIVGSIVALLGSPVYIYLFLWAGMMILFNSMVLSGIMFEDNQIKTIDFTGFEFETDFKTYNIFEPKRTMFVLKNDTDTFYVYGTCSQLTDLLENKSARVLDISTSVEENSFFVRLED